MIQKHVAGLLALLLFGMCSPAIAGDFINPRFRAPEANLGARVALPGNFAAFGLPQAGQPHPSQSQPKRGMTKGGKIMTVIGLAMVGTGAVMIAKGGTSAVTNEVGVDWRKSGYAWVSVGGVLALIGLTRRH